MPAQEHDTAHCDGLFALDYRREDILCLKDGKFHFAWYRGKGEDGRFIIDWDIGKRDDYHLNYTFNGRDYRRLSKRELARLDAMSNVKVRRGRLYFDGKKIKINAWWVSEVHSAHYWNGGVVLTAETTFGVTLPEYMDEAGFIDLQTGTCRLSKISTYAYDRSSSSPLDFLTPVTMDTSNKDLTLDVTIPESTYLFEKTNMTVAITNVSDRPLLVPDSLAEGLGMVLLQHLAKPSEYAKKLYGENIEPSPKKWPECPDVPDFTYSPLLPGERREEAIPIDVARMFFRTGRHHVAFYWDALLDSSDRGHVTRIMCEKQLEIAEAPPVDTSSKDLVLDVRAPATVSLEGREPFNDPYFLASRSTRGLEYDVFHASGTFKVKVAITNVSGRTILVPDDLGDGLGVVQMYPEFRLPGGKVVRIGLGRPFLRKDQIRLLSSGADIFYKPSSSMGKYPAIRCPYVAHCSPLAPGATRETTVLLDPLRLAFWNPADRYHMTFVWDGLLDPDDRGHVSRFSTGKTVWVDVTK